MAARAAQWGLATEGILGDVRCLGAYQRDIASALGRAAVRSLLDGFTSNSTYAVHCRDSVDHSFCMAYITTNSAGDGLDTTTCYSSLGAALRHRRRPDGDVELEGNANQHQTADSDPPPSPSWDLTLRPGDHRSAKRQLHGVLQ